MKRCMFFTVSMVVYLFAVLVNADIPRKISFQGYLSTPSGVPVTGEYVLDFAIYDSQVGGEQLWNDMDTLEISNGQFHAYLGDNTPLPGSIFTGDIVWLETSVDGGMITERQPIVSSAYSFRSLVADTSLYALSAGSAGDTLWQRKGDDVYRVLGNLGLGTSDIYEYGRLTIEQGHDDWVSLRSEQNNNIWHIHNPAEADRLEVGYERDGQHEWGLFVIKNNGNVGIGTIDPARKMDVHGPIEIDLREYSGPAGRDGLVIEVSPDNGSAMLITNAPTYGFWSYSRNRLADIEADAGLFHDMVTVPVLKITGGADIAEPFDCDERHVIRPGMVMSIDSLNPGKLKIASERYDRRVAGIVSGAGGVNTGMVMGQEGSIADGEYPIALNGRVYCFADASYGSIECGDLLTTSNTPGHAMKVSDHSRSQGAVLGKAITTLKEGRGLILVLVTLQ